MWNLKPINLRLLKEERLYQHKIHLENLLSAKSNIKTKGPECPYFLKNKVSLKDLLTIQTKQLNYENFQLYKQLHFFSSFSPYSKDCKKMSIHYCPAFDKLRFNFDKKEREREICQENINFFNRFSERKSSYGKKNFMKKNYFENYLKDNINKNNLPNPNLFFCTFNQFKKNLRKKGLEFKKLAKSKSKSKDSKNKDRARSSSLSKEKIKMFTINSSGNKNNKRKKGGDNFSNLNTNSDRFWKCWSPPPLRSNRCDSAFNKNNYNNFQNFTYNFSNSNNNRNNFWDEEYIKNFNHFYSYYPNNEEEKNKTVNENEKTEKINYKKELEREGGINNQKINFIYRNSFTPRQGNYINYKNLKRSQSAYGEQLKNIND